MATMRPELREGEFVFAAVAAERADEALAVLGGG
jgi:hypothetical protein